jgi:serine/threonine-protein kinase RsbW
MLVDQTPETTRVVIPSDPLAVREALCALFDRLMVGTIEDDTRTTAQIVLAEALNNIVEHAYAQTPGDIEVTLEISARGLKCSIVDHGSPMPDGALPDGRVAVPLPGMTMDDLPEGGFGWNLIRTLSQDLSYSRVGGENLLTFRIDATQPDR